MRKIMNKIFPPCPELFCSRLFMAFVVGLAYMGLNVSRSPPAGGRTTMETAGDTTVPAVT
jgi:hypothetical protein